MRIGKTFDEWHALPDDLADLGRVSGRLYCFLDDASKGVELGHIRFNDRTGVRMLVIDGLGFDITHENGEIVTSCPGPPSRDAEGQFPHHLSHLARR